MGLPRIKRRCWWCFLTGCQLGLLRARSVVLPASSVLSAAYLSIHQTWQPTMRLTATLPVGYSPPIPIPTTTISASTSPEWRRLTESIGTTLSARSGWTLRTYIKALIVPWAPPGPFEAAERAEKTNTIRVHANIPNWYQSQNPSCSSDSDSPFDRSCHWSIRMLYHQYIKQEREGDVQSCPMMIPAKAIEEIRDEFWVPLAPLNASG
jgi:hypothetical protein